MNTKLRNGLAVAGIAVVGIVGIALPASANDEKPFTVAGFCGWDPGTDGGTYGHAYGHANVRSGPGAHCDRRGGAEPQDSLHYRCYAAAADGSTWTYVTDERTWLTGWIRDTYLSGGGSYTHC
ncbi:hypothetical protein AB0M43_03140 [Longispora sp. NPDC051575]|uniref:hypothetical protein n=1 Tax=Longispora sp. NPDC051575 TaxID=3154943 RepID=UPI00342FB7A6